MAVVLGVKNRAHLEKILKKADDANFKYFPVYDLCRTELEPEEEDGTTLTCVGFLPYKSDMIDLVTRRCTKEDDGKMDFTEILIIVCMVLAGILLYKESRK